MYQGYLMLPVYFPRLRSQNDVKPYQDIRIIILPELGNTGPAGGGSGEQSIVHINKIAKIIFSQQQSA